GLAAAGLEAALGQGERLRRVAARPLSGSLLGSWLQDSYLTIAPTCPRSEASVSRRAGRPLRRVPRAAARRVGAPFVRTPARARSRERPGWRALRPGRVTRARARRFFIERFLRS